jgi:hypothetical protein
LLKQANPDLDDEALDNIMENAMEDDNGASTSTHMHDIDKVILKNEPNCKNELLLIELNA